MNINMHKLGLQAAGGIGERFSIIDVSAAWQHAFDNVT
jgi:hypothetical protein